MVQWNSVADFPGGLSVTLNLTAYFISSWLKASGISPVSTSKAETGVEQKAPHAIRNALCCITSNLLFVLSEAELLAIAP